MPQENQTQDIIHFKDITRVLSCDIVSHLGKTITIQGWVHRVRELGGVSFILIRDRSGIAQVVLDQNQLQAIQENQQHNPLKPETVLSIQGTVAASEKAPQGAELHNPKIVVLAAPLTDLPIAINTPLESMGIDTLLNNRLLSLRIPKMKAIFEVQSVIIEGFANFLRAQGFTEIKTSKLINSGTEGGTGLFEVEYFDIKVFLAQSPQFYKQAGVASGLERVFEIGAAYRAEKHETNRHLNEYISLDLEMGFIDDVNTLLDLEIGIMQHVAELLNSRCAHHFQEWEVPLIKPELFEKTPRITYDDAKKISSREGNIKVLEIDPNAEKLLSTWAEKECGLQSVFITDFPRRKRPFYAMPDSSGQKTLSFDYIFNGVEITTGGLRQHNYEALVDSVKKFGMNPESLEDYLSIFKYSCPPHGGFAIGLERLTQKFLGLSNVKLASMFPRDRNRVTP